MYAVSWSGGKDGCLAAYMAIRQGLPVRFLLNTISERYQRVRFHGVPRAMVQAQAEAMGLTLCQWPTPDEAYEEAFQAALRALKEQGVHGVIFGDLFPEGHREWGQRMCAAAGLEAWHPLFGQRSEDVVAEFLAAGFEAIIVSGRPDYFSAAQMGLPLSEEFLAWAREQPGLDLGGENGEYHTLVLDGPLFRQRLVITEAVPVQIQGHWFLDLRAWHCQPK